MREVMLIAGTRPEAIKMVPVLLALRKASQLRVLLCSTGQHREMLRQVWEDFDISPDLELDVMTQGQTLAELTARLVNSLDAVLAAHRPDIILVQGDTTTVMAASLCAFYRRIPVGHVEAGLRSDDLGRPFPEELNRRVTTLAATLHFAPTPRAEGNLLREGVSPERVFVTGNTVVDALYAMRDSVRRRPPALPPALAEVIRTRRPLVLVTVHRRELDALALEELCGAVRELAREFPQTAFVLPMHPSPRVRDIVSSCLNAEPNIFLTEPLRYPVFVFLLERCRLVLSDSGGIQEEAPSFGKRVLVLREVTERPEGVEAGFCQLIGVSARNILAAARPLLEGAPPDLSAVGNPFGDGRAAERIRTAVERFLAEISPE